MQKLIRTLVITVALIGSFTSLNVTKANAKTIAKPGFLPIPYCPPNDPHYCGLGQ